VAATDSDTSGGPGAPGLEPAWADRRMAFGAWAVSYDRFRPGYPPVAAGWLVGDVAGRRHVVDLGAGTGRLSAVLADLGHQVLAVEPDEGMRAVAERALPGHTAAGSAEHIPAADASVDAVVAGQAYHWFDPPRALPEIARVLRPGGYLGIMWNVREEHTGWSRELSDLIGGEDRRAAEGRGRSPDVGTTFFHAPEARTFRHVQALDVDSLVGLVGSYSYVALRPDRDDVLARAREIAVRGATGPDGQVLVRYVLRAYRARRLP
jgi:SAM-dependent methyltransferase